MQIHENFNLKNYNSYRLNSYCRKAYFPESKEDIRTLFKTDQPKRIILGGGYNVILSKDFYDEEFVVFADSALGKKRLEADSLIYAEAGVNIKVLSEYALEHELSGLEIYYDIPSSLGGAIVMNAGAGGEDIKALLKKVEYYDPFKDQFIVLNATEIDFEYRNSFFQKNPHLVICNAFLKLLKKDKAVIWSKMLDNKEARWAKQPREFPNAGSVFKRPPGRFVGPMIQELGLKGYTVGGAKISEKHAGFIVNFNDASGKDILEIIDYAQRKVKENFGVDLEVEQRII